MADQDRKADLGTKIVSAVAAMAAAFIARKLITFVWTKAVGKEPPTHPEDPQVALTEALEATWRRDPGLYYEDGYQELADRGGEVAAAPIGDVEWVEVDDHRDLRRARAIAGRC